VNFHRAPLRRADALDIILGRNFCFAKNDLAAQADVGEQSGRKWRR